jgi:predicted DNA-binding protein YlxM (UPF0122 family)
MLKRVRLTQKQKVDIINAYETELVPMIKLAEQYAVSRQAIHKLLKNAKIDTTKHKIQVSCTNCGKTLHRWKMNIRRNKHHFCDVECYRLFKEAGLPTLYSRQGSNIARSVVSQYFALQSEHRVHHKNKNQFDNSIENLMVFANQGDHIRFHNRFDVNPIFDGSETLSNARLSLTNPHYD